MDDLLIRIGIMGLAFGFSSLIIGFAIMMIQEMYK